MINTLPKNLVVSIEYEDTCIIPEYANSIFNWNRSFLEFAFTRKHEIYDQKDVTGEWQSSFFLFLKKTFLFFSILVRVTGTIR